MLRLAGCCTTVCVCVCVYVHVEGVDNVYVCEGNPIETPAPYDLSRFAPPLGLGEGGSVSFENESSCNGKCVYKLVSRASKTFTNDFL